MEIKKQKFAIVILSVLFFANVLAWTVVFDLERSRFLEVNFFDVSQGDAIFIETPERNQILIDGGPSSAILEKLGKEMPFWDRTIDLVILTHFKKDHVTGLLEVLKKYKVENILWTGEIKDIPEYKIWQTVLKKKKVKIFIAKNGQKISCKTSTSKPCQIEILYPFKSLEGQRFKESNDASIVAKLIFGENSFLFTGDISKKIEGELIYRYSVPDSRQGTSLQADVLKVAHHGSKKSTLEEFVKIVLPQIAVISVGKNFYGHPHQEVLEILAKYGISRNNGSLLRTDLDGDIKILSDGKNLKIKK